MEPRFEIGDSSWLQNVGGSLTTVALTAAGSGFWAWLLRLEAGQLMFAMFIALATVIGFYAEFYHRAVEADMPKKKFYLGVALSAFVPTLFTCGATKLIMELISRH